MVAWGFAHRRWHRTTDNGYVWLGVLSAARARGVGTALWQLAARRERPSGPGTG